MAELGRLMLVTDRALARGRSLEDVVASAVHGGVDVVQLREKDLTDDALRALLARLRERVPPSTLLLVNGRERVARTTGAGLHLPTDARPPQRFAGVWGRSVHDETEARAAAEQGAAWVVAGPVFRTASKPGHPGSGIGFLRRTVEIVAPVPVFAIGGIDAASTPGVIHAGAHGIAVRGALMQAADPRRVAEALRLALRVSR